MAAHGLVAKPARRRDLARRHAAPRVKPRLADVDTSLINALAESPLVHDNVHELVADLCSTRALEDPFMVRLIDTVAWVRCPALERVVLLSLPDGTGEGAGSISIEPDTVARLRHVLRRPALQLILSACCTQGSPDAPQGSTYLPQPASDVDPAALSAVGG